MAPLNDRAAADAMFDRLDALLRQLAIPKPAFGWAALCARMPG